MSVIGITFVLIVVVVLLSEFLVTRLSSYGDEAMLYVRALAAFTTLNLDAAA